jgi:hypothetical protein
VTCRALLSSNGSEILISGSLPVPDRVIINAGLHRISERLNGTKLEKQKVLVNSIQQWIKNKSFDGSFSIETQGEYEIELEVPRSGPNADHSREIESALGDARTWTFTFMLWTDPFLEGLQAKMKSVFVDATEVQMLIRRFENSATTESTWEAAKDKLYEAGVALGQKLQEGPEYFVFHASIQALHRKVRWITDPPKSFQGDIEAMWQKLKQPFDESICGKELTLWLIKDLRRTSGKRSDSWRAALSASKELQGVKEWALQLSDVTAEALDFLELKVRGIPSSRVGKPGD